MLKSSHYGPSPGFERVGTRSNRRHVDIRAASVTTSMISSMLTCTGEKRRISAKRALSLSMKTTTLLLRRMDLQVRRLARTGKSLLVQ